MKMGEVLGLLFHWRRKMWAGWWKRLKISTEERGNLTGERTKEEETTDYGLLWDGIGMEDSWCCRRNVEAHEPHFYS